MREIEFRGMGVLGIWEYGHYVCTQGAHFIAQIDLYGKQTSCVRVPAMTVGQYTGLKDKSGKKIFEGDIVRRTLWVGGVDKHKTYIVKWDNKEGINYLWGIKRHGVSCDDIEIRAAKEGEIIGDIHSNPELLEGGGE